MAMSPAGIAFFVQYVCLFVTLAVLVKLSQTKAGYSYNTTLVVFIVEVVKLTVALSMSIHTYGVSSMLTAIRKNVALIIMYFVPSILYTFHNNLMFYSMKYLDPATYYVLLQFRVIVTGVLFQMLFKKYLTRVQWMALMILFAGCLLKELDRNTTMEKPIAVGTTEEPKSSANNLVIFVVLFQVVCSCGAAVYTEYLLKSASEHANVHLQNVFMYGDSIVCNSVLLIARATSSSSKIVSASDFSALLQPYVIAIIAVSAAGGLTTAFLLKYLDSVLKVYANSFEIILTAIATYFILGVKISSLSYVALFTVCVSLFLYRRGDVPKNDTQVELSQAKNHGPPDEAV